MKLINADLARKIPALYTTENQKDAAIVHTKFFIPSSGWTWYVLEYDGDDLCFGLVVGHETELGYFTISELEDLELPYGLKVERDLHWHPITIGELREQLDNWGIV